MAEDERIADGLTLAERQQALEYCDRVRSSLAASHLIHRALRSNREKGAGIVACGSCEFKAELFLADFRDVIFANLQVVDLGSASAVCKDWASATVWLAAYERRWGCEGNEDIGKLAYAMRDACESRTHREAELVAEAETLRLKKEWIYREMEGGRGSYPCNNNKSAEVDNAVDYRAAAIERVRGGLLNDAAGTSEEAAKALLALLERGIDVQQVFRMEADVPGVAEEDGSEHESDQCIRFTITSASGFVTYFTFSLVDSFGLWHDPKYCQPVKAARLCAYKLGVLGQPVLEDWHQGEEWTLQRLRGLLHGEPVSAQGAPLWSTHKHRYGCHVRSQEPKYVAPDSGIWPVVMLRSESTCGEVHFECDEVHKLEGLLEDSLGAPAI